MLRKAMIAMLLLEIAAAYSELPTRSADAQTVDSTGANDILNARIAVAALHGPIRLSTLTGVPERAILTGNVNGPDWSPSGDRLVYVDDRGGGEYALSVADTLGATTQLPVPLRSTWPQYSRDGAWIYFFTQNDDPPQVYRITPNGTGLQLLLPGSFPAPAPAGGRIAITVAGGVWVGDPVTRIGAIIPNTTSTAIATRWSPNGQWIAYRERAGGGIVIIRPDGTGKRVIAAPPIGGLSWSPDGNWLLGGNVDGGPLQLIDTRTDVAVFLPVRGVYPVWRPSGSRLIVSAEAGGH